MIFTHAKGLKDYQVERVIQFGSSTSSATKFQVRG
jgi:hypothetical protein